MLSGSIQLPCSKLRIPGAMGIVEAMLRIYVVAALAAANRQRGFSGCRHILPGTIFNDSP